MTLILRIGRCSLFSVGRVRGWLLIALGFAIFALPVDAASPSPREYLRACGIGDKELARFNDDRQIADEEFDIIRRIAVRLRDCPESSLNAMIAAETPFHAGGRGAGQIPSPAEAASVRGQCFRVGGRVASVEQAAEGISVNRSEPLWRCTITLDQAPHQAVLYVADMPEWLRGHGAGQRVAFDGIFLKYTPGTTGGPVAVLVAPHPQWQKDTPLGNLGMDLGLMDGIRDNCPLNAADSDAFFQLLVLTKKADTACWPHEAERVDSNLASSLFHDPTGQRGRLVRLYGTARRVVRVPIDDPAIVARLGADHYYEIDVVADELQNNPLTFCTLDLPPEMPLGGPPAYREMVEATGFFLKTWQYPASLSEGEKSTHPGSIEALQTAPLIIGPAPRWKPAEKEKKSSTAMPVGGLVALVMIGVCLLLLSLRQSDQQFSQQVIARE
jgi:hypothetical protein